MDTPHDADDELSSIELRERLSEKADDAVAVNDSLREGAHQLLAGQDIVRVFSCAIHDDDGHLKLSLELRDRTLLEASACARITGRLAEVLVVLGGNPAPGDEPSGLPVRAESPSPPAVLLGCARALLEGRTIAAVECFEVYDSLGQISFEVRLDDGQLIEAPVAARLSGPIADLARLAGGNPD